MDRDRWRRVEQLYNEALAREARDRAGFLADACGSDEELRREVESLLKQDVTQFLEPRLLASRQSSMDPHIQYARAPDGTSLAYWRIGEGPPLVIAATYPWSHLELEWDIPEVRRFLRGLAGPHTLIRYDGRGVGLSEKVTADLSLDVLVSDLAAIVDHLSLESFDLLGVIAAGPIAIKYASLNPHRVKHLVLWSTYARPADYMESTQVQATRSLIDKDWELYTEAVSSTLLGWSAGEPARRYAAFIRGSATREAARAFMGASRHFDVSQACRHITCPALVMHRLQSTWLDVESSKRLAAMIPGAELRTVDGESVLPFLGNVDLVVREIVSFTQGSGLPLQQDSPAREGETLSHYQLVKQIGAGGMGELYLARDLMLERTVALKLLVPAVAADQDHLQRFIQEAKAASSLNHPNVCIVYEIGGVESARPFIAMEYLDGETIEAKITQGPLKFSEILDIGGQVLSGLGEAHAHGIIHRDIKPQNVMITQRGVAKILDFGLARIMESNAAPGAGSLKITAPGIIAGTAQYMSPEQTLGRRVDHRTDIFSFGLTLYEMATGRPAFSGATPLEVMENIRRQQPERIAAINSAIPAEFERIIMKCLEKDPERRYQSTTEIAEDWTRVRSKTVTLSQTRKRLVRWGAAVTLGVIVLGIGTIAFQFLHFNKVDTGGQTPVKVLVLPFTNMSGDAENEYLSAGITEELINALTKNQNMRVVSGVSIKETNIDVRELKKRLGVDRVVEGSVQKVGNRLRVSAQLVNTDDGYHVWSNMYDRNMEDVFTIEDEISGSIARSVVGEVSAAKTSTTNIDAYRRYVQARYLWNKRTPGDLMKAIELFREATTLDPNYAPAYVGIADSFVLLASYEYGVMKPADAVPQARAAAMKALAINDLLPEAHVSLAQILYQFDWDWKGAEAEFKRAIELNPGYATGHHWYGEFLSARGRFDESLREIEAAEMLDPLSLIIQTAHARVLYFARKYDLAIEKYQQAIGLEPSFLVAHVGLGYAYTQTSMHDDALAEFQKAIDIAGPAPVLLGSLGFAAGLSGDKAKALELLEGLKQMSSTMYVMPAYLTAIYLGLNDRDQAILAIEQAYRDKSGFIAFLGVEPAVDALRSDPRFKNLLARANVG